MYLFKELEIMRRMYFSLPAWCSYGSGKRMFRCWRDGMKRCGRCFESARPGLVVFQDCVWVRCIWEHFLQSVIPWWMLSCCLGEGKVQASWGDKLSLRMDYHVDN